MKPNRGLLQSFFSSNDSIRAARLLVLCLAGSYPPGRADTHIMSAHFILHVNTHHNCVLRPVTSPSFAGVSVPVGGHVTLTYAAMAEHFSRLLPQAFDISLVMFDVLLHDCYTGCQGGKGGGMGSISMPGVLPVQGCSGLQRCA